MPPKKPSSSPDADALPDAVERLADEVRTLRTALDEFQDSFAYELRRLRDVLTEVMGHEVENRADDVAMTIDGVHSTARQVERAAGFPGETPLADQSNPSPQTDPNAVAMTADIRGRTPAVCPGDPKPVRPQTGAAGRLF